MANQLFAKKSLEAILKEMAGEHRLKRALGPVTLTALGIGAVIGAGIFVATGAAAKDVAGPALMVSYMFAGVTCVFAALCYAEFASMAPVAGSAYTYAYTTLGELFAWIIGWDLVLEYAVGAATVANSWSGYLQSVLGSVSIILPMTLTGAPQKYDQGHVLPNMVAKIDGQAVSQVAIKEKEASWPDGAVKAAEGVFWVKIKERTGSEVEPLKDAKGHVEVIGPVEDSTINARVTDRENAYFNLPAVLITFIMTLILIKGISESASFNAIMVAIKVAAVLFVVVVGACYIKPANWTNDFAPYGWTGLSIFGYPLAGQTNPAGDPVGVLAGAAIIFFAYIGFDAVSTQAEEARNPQRDVPIGIIASLLICTVLYIAVVAVLTGMVPYKSLSKDAGVADAFRDIDMKWAQVIIAIAGVAGITSVLLVMMLSAPRVFLAMARDGLVPRGIFARIHPKFQTPWISTILIGTFVALMTAFLPITALLHLTNIGTLFAFVIVCTAVLIMRRTNPEANRPFRCPLVPLLPALGIAACLVMMLSLPPANWYRLFGWLALGLIIYFSYGRRHSLLGKQLRGEISTHGVSGAGMIDMGNK
jgi:APA family basic amino acid/polyamine antiporter